MKFNLKRKDLYVVLSIFRLINMSFNDADLDYIAIGLPIYLAAVEEAVNLGAEKMEGEVSF